MRVVRTWFVLTTIVAIAACSSPPPELPPVDEATYVAEVEAWRSERIVRLQREDGWLSLVGLDWLEEGDNTFGTAEEGDIVFPEGTAPPRAGTLVLEDGVVRLVPASGAGLLVNDEPATERPLAPDVDGKPDIVRVGDLTFYVIRRSGRLGVRSKHPEAPSRTGFHGLDYYDVNLAYRVAARFEPYDEPREVAVPTVLDEPEMMTAPGLLRFVLDGRECTLQPMISGNGLFIIFKDATSGKETYGAGRFLYTGLPEDGVVVLDFNKAYNPPCAFTPYATCPLPPKQNALEVAVEAGEKDYGAH